MAFTRFTKNVLNVSALPDRVQNQAQALKATFDQAGVDIKTALNAFIAELEMGTSASNLGADVKSVATKTVQAILTAFEQEIANRYTKGEIDTLVSSNTNNLVSDVDINLTTGVITVTKKDGTTETFDTALEKVPAKFEIVENGDSLFLKITNVDGTYTQTDITDLMNIYEFSNTDEVAFDVTGTGNEKVVTASIRANSIGLDKLSLSVVTTLEGYANSARDSATAARTSEINAISAANTASDAAEIASDAAEISRTAISSAKVAESYAVGGTGTREGEDTDNAKYYSRIAKDVAGGNYVTPTEMEAYAQKKGTAPSFEGEELSGEVIEADVPLAMESVLKVSGNSEQDSRSGKNLFNKYGDFSYGKSDALFTSLQADGTILTTANYGSSRSAGQLIENIKPNTYYVLSGTLISASGTKTDGNVVVEVMDVSNKRIGRLTINPSEIKPYSFNLKFHSGDNTSFWISLSGWNASSAEGGTLTVFDNIQIEQGSVATPYEPYGVQPSPDYPSDIRSVKSKSDNLFNKSVPPKYVSNSPTQITEIDTGVRITLGASTEVSAYPFGVFIIKDVTNDVGKVARINAKMTPSSTGLKPMYHLILCDAEGGNRVEIARNEQTNVTLKATIPELTGNQTYLAIRLYGTSGGTGTATDYTDFTNIMVTIDKEIKNYQPYGYVPVEAKVEGKNLFDYKKANEGTKRSTVDDDGWITTEYDNTNGTNEIYGQFYTDNLDLKPSTQYALFVEVKNVTGNPRCEFASVHATSQIATKVYESNLSSGLLKYLITTTNSFETATNGLRTVIAFRAGTKAAITYRISVLEDTSISKENFVYEPYKTKTISLPLGDIELRSTPDGTRDTFERVDGVWNVLANIYSGIFDGSDDENIVKNEYGTNSYRIYITNRYLRDSSNVLTTSNRFISKSYNDRTVNIDNILYVDQDAVSSNITVRNTNFTTLEEFKTWLSNNPTEVIYPLLTPTYTPITDEALIKALDELESLILHKGYNRITATSVNGVKAELDLLIPPTASVTNVVETESAQDMIVPVVSSEGEVKVKIPAENQMTLNPSTGMVKVNGKEIATKEYVDENAGANITYGTEDLTAGVSTLATGAVYFVYE